MTHVRAANRLLLQVVLDGEGPLEIAADSQALRIDSIDPVVVAPKITKALGAVGLPAHSLSEWDGVSNPFQGEQVNGPVRPRDQLSKLTEECRDEVKALGVSTLRRPGNAAFATQDSTVDCTKVVIAVAAVGDVVKLIFYSAKNIPQQLRQNRAIRSKRGTRICGLNLRYQSTIRILLNLPHGGRECDADRLKHAPTGPLSRAAN